MTVRASTLWSAAATATAALSTPSLFVAFLYAYGFQDDVDWSDHASFLTTCLVLTATEAIVVGLLVLAVGRAQGWARLLTLGPLVTFGLNLLALAAGVGVSLANEGQGSVTADQPDGPFYAVLAAALAVGAACLGAATRVVPPRD
ncbi:hypothetical protein ASD11_10740 [Aeromicrobium sp. Root495]|nr:hypothetical protein ASD11_10740 [Aeromicrobium sp. Root495]